MCPHGAGFSEEVQLKETFTTFEQLKKAGKVRFLGVSSHNDPAGVLRAARETGHYEVAMVAFNVINGGYMEREIELAKESGASKKCKELPGNMKAPVKAYLWALQNPNLSAVISNLWDEQNLNDNLSVAGKKLRLQPG